MTKIRECPKMPINHCTALLLKYLIFSLTVIMKIKFKQNTITQEFSNYVLWCNIFRKNHRCVVTAVARKDKEELSIQWPEKFE